jgi:hypothetical protein
VDKVRSEAWADGKPKKVFSPAIWAEEKFHYALKRGGRRVSPGVTISMAGDMLTPLYVIHWRTIDGAMMRTLF